MINITKDRRYYSGDDFYNILLIGTGGTGGYVAQMIAQYLSIFSKKGQIILADKDVVEAKNLKNQLFVQKDIGKPKAEVLAKRYSAAYSIPISSFTDRYLETIEDIDSMWLRDYDITSGAHYKIIISCVDNNYTRQVLHQYFTEHDKGNLIYIDVGNEAVNIPMDIEQSQWSEEDKENFQTTGYTGQCVVGYKFNKKVILSPTASVFPDILDDHDEIKPSEASCGDIVVSQPQRLITNRYSALVVGTVMNEIFDTQTISNHVIHFHSKKCYIRGQKAEILEENN